MPRPEAGQSGAHSRRRARDAAYHQGTVWNWLEGFLPHLGEACLGTVSEIFDAEPPFHARGCVSQAWSVAELLRCWLKTAG